jgi:hypothetical protein
MLPSEVESREGAGFLSLRCVPKPYIRRLSEGAAA